MGNSGRHVYGMFGLTVAAPCVLPGFDRVAGEGRADIEISLGRVDQPDAATMTQLGPGLWADEHSYRIDIAKLMRLRVSEGRTIVVEPMPACDLAALPLFLLGSAVPAALIQRGFTLLRGTAIGWRGRPIAIVGRGSVGKSALAVAMLRRGATFWADDYLALGPNDLLYPGAFRLTLWADMMRPLNFQRAEPLRPGLPRYGVQPPGVRENEPQPIEHFVHLSLTADAQAYGELLTGVDRFHVLEQSAFLPQMLAVARRRQAFFQRCATVSRGSTVSSLARQRSGGDLAVLADAVEALVQP